MRRSSGGWPLWPGVLLIGAGVLLILAGWHSAQRSEEMTPPGAPATLTPEPLVPTRTPGVRAETAGDGTSPTSAQATHDPFPTAVSGIPRESDPAQGLWEGRLRWGAGVASGSIARDDVAPLRVGWYVDWGVHLDPPRPEGVEYVQMVRVRGGVLKPDTETVAAIARANPGSLWLVGNEPDVKWQDGIEPEVYARLYGEAYGAIKRGDPGAQVAIGGVSQPTPLRLRYLEAVLAAYREQFGAKVPVDVWNVHNFILREERDSWGVDIPPGMPDQHGMLYEIEDCGDLGIFQQQIIDFRRWMAEKGYQDRPLIISEYGIPMPEDYGFPPGRVVAFLADTFDFFLTATDPATGYPGDDHRLVQRWCWYSLDAPDTYYPDGRLFNPQTGEMTPVGVGWQEIVARLISVDSD